MLNAVLRSHWSIFGKNESCGQSCGSFTEVIPGTPQFFPFECSTALWSGRESVVLATDKGALWPKPVKDDCS